MSSQSYRKQIKSPQYLNVLNHDIKKKGTYGDQLLTTPYKYIQEMVSTVHNNEPMFSVIIPIYNVQDYIEECVESVLAQSCGCFEVILVDDGSTDNSPQICDKYEKLANCTVVHQRNSGLSSARNTGISKAKGEYLMFLDSDDYIAIDALENFKSIIDRYHPDIVKAYAYRLLSDGSIEPKIKDEFKTDEVLKGSVYYEKMVKSGRYTCCAPFAICRRDLISKNNLSFKEGVLHEDELWTPQLFFSAQSVACGNFYFYYHRIREGSITNQNDISRRRKRNIDKLKICEELLKIVQIYGRNNTKYLRNHIAVQYMSATYEGRLDQGCSDIINRKLPLKNACQKRDIVKAFIFALSPRLYCELDKSSKEKNS